MRILLDECVDRRLALDIEGHDVKTAQQMGWMAVRNGELLALASREFDVFVTVDRNLSFQQNRATLPLTVVVLQARSNRLDALRPLVKPMLAALSTAQPRTIVTVGATNS